MVVVVVVVTSPDKVDEIGFIGFNSIPPSGSLPDINFGILSGVTGLEIGFKGRSNWRADFNASLFLVLVSTLVSVVVVVVVMVVTVLTGVVVFGGVGNDEVGSPNVILRKLADAKVLSFEISVPS